MVHEDFRKVSFAQHFVLLPSLLRSLQQQVSQAKMRTKIIRCFPPSFVFFLYYYFFNSSWAFRRTLLASIACNSRGWIISQERSRISNAKQRLYTPTTRRRIPSHSIDHNSLISASLSKVSLIRMPELQSYKCIPYFPWFRIFIFQKAQISAPNFQRREPWTDQVWHASLLLASHHNGKNISTVTLPGEGQGFWRTALCCPIVLPYCAPIVPL